jgi:hypothetical protein
VVEELRAAGFTAERQTLEVERSGDGTTSMSHVSDDASSGVGMVAMTHGEEGGAHGLVGLSVTLPADLLPGPLPDGDDGPSTSTGGTPGSGPTHSGPTVEAEAADGAGPAFAPELEEAGVRFESEGGVSLRAGTDATIVVYTEH